MDIAAGVLIPSRRTFARLNCPPILATAGKEKGLGEAGLMTACTPHHPTPSTHTQDYTKHFPCRNWLLPRGVARRSVIKIDRYVCCKIHLPGLL